MLYNLTTHLEKYVATSRYIYIYINTALMTKNIKQLLYYEIGPNSDKRLLNVIAWLSMRMLLFKPTSLFVHHCSAAFRCWFNIDFNSHLKALSANFVSNTACWCQLISNAFQCFSHITILFFSLLITFKFINNWY